MVKGRCLCGAVEYIYKATIINSILCYCRDCQMAQGSLMAWNSPLNQNDFEITKGLESIKSYFHTPLKARVFCGDCGSPLYSYRTDLPNIIRLRLGTITKGDIPVPKEQFFKSDNLKFIEINLS